MNTKNLEQFLQGLGLDQYEAKIYTTLVKKGILTTLEVARETGIDRAKVYRRLEVMKRKGIVEEVIDENKKRVKAVDIDRLELILQEKEEKVQDLRSSFKDIKLLLSGSVGMNDPETKVLFYRGKDGIKQMVWNVLRAKGEVVGYTYSPISEAIGKKFLRKFVLEFERRNLYFRDVYTDKYNDKNNPDAQYYSLKRFEGRVIQSKVLEIDHQMDIYNDVVSYYKWYEGDIFGVEIYNKSVAKMQRQLFEIVWKIASHNS